MVLDLCVAGLIRLFAVQLKFVLYNWGWAITFLVGVFLLSRIPLVAEMVADAVDWVSDVFAQALAATGIGLVGSFISGGVSGMLVGFVWVYIGLQSQANFILKIVTIPFFFLTGFIIGLLPNNFFGIPVPLSTIVGAANRYIFTDEITSNLICAIPILILIFFFIMSQYLFGDSFCAVVNSASLMLV